MFCFIDTHPLGTRALSNKNTLYYKSILYFKLLLFISIDDIFI